MKALVVGALIDVIGRLIGVIEKRVNKPAPKPNHGGVSDAEIDRLLKKSKELN